MYCIVKETNARLYGQTRTCPLGWGTSGQPGSETREPTAIVKPFTRHGHGGTSEQVVLVLTGL
jgi:hypothetical protein